MGRPDSERDRLKILRSVAAALALLIALPACDGGPDSQQRDSSLGIAVRATSSLDPAFLRDATGILVARQIFEPLLSFDPATSRVGPGLASSYEVHDGGSRFVFHLGDSKFHNGRLVNAGDVIYSMNRLASKTMNSEAAFLLDAVAGFHDVNATGTSPALQGLREVDTLTVEITLSSPWFDFPFVLTHPSTAPVPKETVEAAASSGGSEGGFAKNPVGNGPFQMAAPLGESGDILLERVSGHPRKPKIESISLLAYEEPEVAWRDLEAGTIDVAEIPPGKAGIGRSKYGSRGLTPVAAGLYIGFNLANPKFADVRLRRAISLAIDRAALARFIYQDSLTPARAVVPKGIVGRSDLACGKKCTRDLEEARRLISEVFPQGGAPELAYDYPSGMPDEGVAEALKSSLAEVGLNLVLRPRERELQAFFDVLESKQQEMFRLVWPAEYPLSDWFLFPLFRSGSPDNHTAYSKVEVDDLLNRARATQTRSERLGLYREVEKQVLADMPVIPIGFFVNRFAAAGKVEGFYVDQLGGFEVRKFQLSES